MHVVCPAFFPTNLMDGARAPESDKNVARKLMNNSGDTADSVAQNIYRGMERGQFMILPTKAETNRWRVKRFFPNAFYRALVKAVGQRPSCEMSTLLIYGANGYTGRLTAKEAAKRGMKPVLAGRNRDDVVALANELKLPYRAFDLSNTAEVMRNLEGIDVVLHCAGPFSKTSAPMLHACLESKTHYLDITGEVDVFEACHRADARAKERGIVVLPGSGFDVVPTDCVAAMLKKKMPNATSLVLAFEAGGGPSPGTAKTSVEGLARGGRARINGELKVRPARLERPHLRTRRQTAHRDDDSVGRSLHRVRLDRNPEHRNLYGRVAEDDRQRAPPAPFQMADRFWLRAELHEAAASNAPIADRPSSAAATTAATSGAK